MTSSKLVLADVDGTLLTREKILTVHARKAVTNLRDAGVAFAITSGRPPRGMEMLIKPLEIATPIAAFNGGLFVRPDLSLIEQRVLQPPVVAPVIEIIKAHTLDVWIYRGTDWFVRERHGSHVDREERTVKFPPTVTSDFGDKMDNVAKIVGVSDDLDAVAKCERAVREQFGNHVHCQRSNPGCESPAAVSAARSQPYYLDVTHPDANKGAVVLNLSKMLGVPASEIITIGDMPNDMTMFAQSGLSVAMGQSSDEVKEAATYVTTSSEEEGFANAIERYVLKATSHR